MKAGNWLWQHVRHTRDGDRTFKEGRISAHEKGLTLRTDTHEMKIYLTDEEIGELEFQLRKVIYAKKQEKNKPK